MKRPFPLKLATLTLLLFAAPSALAYVGPGAGLSLLGALWGLIVAVGAALVFVILWPFRRLVRRLRARRAADGDAPAPAAGETGSEGQGPGR